MTVLFCKYLCNYSSDLHKISCGVQLLSSELKFQIYPCTNTRARVLNACTRNKTCASSFTTRAPAFLCHIKFHKELLFVLSFRSGDICKTILMFNPNFKSILQNF